MANSDFEVMSIDEAKKLRDAVERLMVAAEEWSLYVVEDCAPVTLVNYLREALK